MGRVNNIIDGVFIDIVGDNGKSSSYSKFINTSDDLGVVKKSKKFVNDYKKIINSNKKTFEQLASLEEIVIQQRIVENLGSVTLYSMREYVYARSPFYRKGRGTKDIRVIIKKVLPGEDVKKLFGNKDLNDLAVNKLKELMVSELEENISRYNKLYPSKK